MSKEDRKPARFRPPPPGTPMAVGHANYHRLLDGQQHNHVISQKRLRDTFHLLVAGGFTTALKEFLDLCGVRRNVFAASSEPERTRRFQIGGERVKGPSKRLSRFVDDPSRAHPNWIQILKEVEWSEFNIHVGPGPRSDDPNENARDPHAVDLVFVCVRRSDVDRMVALRAFDAAMIAFQSSCTDAAGRSPLPENHPRLNRIEDFEPSDLARNQVRLLRSHMKWVRRFKNSPPVPFHEASWLRVNNKWRLKKITDFPDGLPPESYSVSDFVHVPDAS